MTSKTSNTVEPERIDQVEQGRRRRGRPRLHADDRAARAAASRAYRARRRAARAARRAGVAEPLHSDVISLDHLAPWRRR
jgi:hypothetical protein